MGKFIIAPHFRLHEWIAEEKGYFRDENLDYEFREEGIPKSGIKHDMGDKVGAYQTYEKGRSCNVSSACHWTVNVAASSGHGVLYADAYSVSPSGIFVPPESDIKKPEDLANVPISVGYQSGSHYSTIQVLETFLKSEEINLTYSDGLLFRRMELLYDRKIPAAGVFSGPFYFLEQLGFRKIVDTTFMMAAMLTNDADLEDVKKYYNALRRAQIDIDLRLELYRHHYATEFPERFRDMLDLNRFGPGERIVFEPYDKEIFERSFEWIAEHNLFPDGEMGHGNYEQATVSVAG